MTDKQGETLYRLKMSIETPLNGGSTIIVDKEDIETALSMLKEKDKEIEFQKDIRNTEKNRHKKTEKSLKGIIIKQNTELAEKNAEIERLEKVLDEKYIFVTEARTVYARLMSLDKEDIVKNDLALRNEIYQHIEDNDKKDKIIDLMAEYIFQNVDVEEDICNSAYVECTQETAQDITCINCIKQYFERKSEEWKKI